MERQPAPARAGSFVTGNLTGVQGFARTRGPAERLHDVVDALLYIHRRTHEHEYTGPDDGLEGRDEEVDHDGQA
jgi:hypothetical protein